MRQIVLGTAGHIDHGKTTLVRALTGIDTDRLQEEKERGITIDLGFAELPGREDVRIGVVDVPGHEGFIRNMLAGATGMDLVVLVIAADEGVMPQTREHLAILEFLRVERLVVAVTKRDLVEEEWLELVVDDIRMVLADTRFSEAGILPVSGETGEGIEELREVLLSCADEVEREAEEDLFRLPVDRVFTVHGTGTVVTGTSWSGSVKLDERVRLLPDGPEARVRGIQLHGNDADRAGAGARVALALSGDGVDTSSVQRGQTVVALPKWPASRMLTVELRVLPATGWRIEHNQRVRVHLGTAEVMARCAVPGDGSIEPGDRAWIQLRLEAPVAARAGDRVVVRSYSPVTTIAGGRVAEPFPPKRREISAEDAARLGRLASTDGMASGDEAVAAGAAALELAAVDGVADALLPVVAGIRGTSASHAIAALEVAGSLAGTDGRRLGVAAVLELRVAILDEVDRVHAHEAYRTGAGREQLRARVPEHAPTGIADRIIQSLVDEGVLAVTDGRVHRPDHRPELTAAQTRIRDRLVQLFADEGLAPPLLDELEAELRDDPAFVAILRGLESEGILVQVDDGFMADAKAVEAGIQRVRDSLGGRSALGPADFREALPVTRKHLMPLLGHLDRIGVTRREAEGRTVLEAPSD